MRENLFSKFVFIFLLATLMFYSILFPFLYIGAQGNNILAEQGLQMRDNSKNLSFKMNISENAEAWDISTTIVIKNQLLYVNRDIIIHDNGALILINSVLKMNSTVPGKIGIKVLDGGNLTVIDSVITAYDTAIHYYIKVVNASTFYVRNSEISCVGVRGSAIPQSLHQYTSSSNEADKILASEFPRTGIYVMESNFTVVNSKIQDIECDIVFYKVSKCAMINNTISGKWDLILGESNSCFIVNNTLRSINIAVSYLSANVSVTGNTLIGGGIYIDNFTSITIARNTIYGNRTDGIEIYAYSSVNITGEAVIRDNQLFNCGFFIYGEKRWLTGLVVEGNTVNYKPLVFIVNATNRDLVFENDVGQVIAAYCENITIREVYIRDTRQAILVIDTSNSKLVDNILRSNKIGIWLLKCSSCVIRHNNITENSWGILLWSSINTSIRENVIEDNRHGIHLIDSLNTTIIENIIQRNQYGIYSLDSPNNTIVNNTFRDNWMDIKDNLVQGPLFDISTLIMIAGIFSVAAVMSILIVKLVKHDTENMIHKKSTSTTYNYEQHS